MFRFLLLLIVMLAFEGDGYALPRLDPHTYISPRAFELFPLIQSEVDKNFQNFPHPEYFPALIEHESCISLTHSKCWKSTSRLKTSKEEGIGLGQLTRTWKNGKLRFDTLADMKRAYPRELGELSWSTIQNRSDLQIRTMIVMTRDNYKSLYAVKDTYERTKMADSAYNGGRLNVERSRRVCAMSKGCNPQIWFNNVERYNQKPNVILYGDRTVRQINNHHVRDVFEVRIHKFQPFFTKE